MIMSIKRLLPLIITALLSQAYAPYNMLGRAAVVEGNNAPVLIEIGGYDFEVDNTGTIANVDGIITEFEDDVYLAHSNLAGRFFGNTTRITYANGKAVTYRLSETIIVQALDPTAGETYYTDGVYLYSPTELRERILYRGVSFMTCYEKDRTASWGRIIFIMEEVK